MSSEIATDRPDLVSKFLGADRKESTDPQLKMQEAEEALPPSLSTRTVIKTVMSSKIPNLKGLMKDF
ncbi:hypothetical protein D3C72_2582490 [compost metagenome]